MADHDDRPQYRSQDDFLERMQHLQPRPVHYHFVYTVLPRKLFQGRVAAVLLLQPLEFLESWLRDLWRMMADRFSPVAAAEAGQLEVSLHAIGAHAVLLVQLPEVRRSVEPYFCAIVYTPDVRYFTLGRAPNLGNESGTPRTTLREVAPDGTNSNFGSGPAPTAREFLSRLQHVLDTHDPPREMSLEQAHVLAPRVPPCGPSLLDDPNSMRLLRTYLVDQSRSQVQFQRATERFDALRRALGPDNADRAGLADGTEVPAIKSLRDCEELDVILTCAVRDTGRSNGTRGSMAERPVCRLGWAGDAVDYSSYPASAALREGNAAASTRAARLAILLTVLAIVLGIVFAVTTSPPTSRPSHTQQPAEIEEIFLDDIPTTSETAPDDASATAPARKPQQDFSPSEAALLVAIMEGKVRENPNCVDAGRDLAIAHAILGRSLVTAGQFREAEEPHQRAIEILGGLSRDNPDDSESLELLANVNNSLGFVYLKIGRLTEAGKCIGQAVAACAELRNDAADPFNYRLRHAAMQTNLALVRIHQRQRDEAIELLDRARESLTSMRADPKKGKDARTILRTIWKRKRQASNLRR